MPSPRAFYKGIIEEVSDCMMAATTVSAYLTYFVAAPVYSKIGTMMSESFTCGGFMDVWFNNAGCDKLEEIASLNGAAAWAEGDTLTNFTIVANVLGIGLGVTRWAYHKYQASNQPVHRLYAREDSLLVDGGEDSAPQDLYVELQTQGARAESVITMTSGVRLTRYQPHPPINNIDRVMTIGLRAWYASKFLGLVMAIVGLPVMLEVARDVANEFSCSGEPYRLLFSTDTNGPCAVSTLYYIKTAFAYPWAYTTWSAYSAWMLAVTCQILPEGWRNTLSMPFAAAYRRIAACFSTPSEFSREFANDLKDCIQLSIMAFGLMAIFVGVPYILKDGNDFSSAFLKEVGCDQTFTDLLFSSKFDRNSEICTPLLQLLALDVFPTVAEIYRGLPLAVIVAIGAAVVGSAVGTVAIKCTSNRERLRRTIKQHTEVFNDIFTKGKIASLLFIPISTWGIIGKAIPKANDVLLYSGCDVRFPAFIYDFSEEKCDIFMRYRANGAYISTMWIIFSYSMVICGTSGMALYTAGKLTHAGMNKIKSYRGREGSPSSQLFVRQPILEAGSQVPALEEKMMADDRGQETGLRI